jgi:[protein-PII] uridylyltransferase
VKESKGGLRDLNTLFWIGKYVYQVDTEAELVTKGVFTRREYNAFVKGSDFLWATRCHIHFLMRRPDDRLSFDLQAISLSASATPTIPACSRSNAS